MPMKWIVMTGTLSIPEIQHYFKGMYIYVYFAGSGPTTDLVFKSALRWYTWEKIILALKLNFIAFLFLHMKVTLILL